MVATAVVTAGEHHMHAVQTQLQMGFSTCVRDILLLLLHQAKHGREETEKKHRLQKKAEQEIKGIKIWRQWEEAHISTNALNRGVERGGSKEASAF